MRLVPTYKEMYTCMRAHPMQMHAIVTSLIVEGAKILSTPQLWYTHSGEGGDGSRCPTMVHYLFSQIGLHSYVHP